MWLSALASHSPIFPRPPSLFLASDASDTGWGARVNGRLLMGIWSAPQLAWHINRKELFAVRQAVTEVLDTLPGYSVLV